MAETSETHVEKRHPQLLELEEITKRFTVRSGLLSSAQLTAVDQVSFAIGEGETVGLVGESGCGKSTIGRSILHLTDIDAGSVRFDGREVSHLSEDGFHKYRKDIQMVFQNPLASFNPLFTIRQALLDPLGLCPEMTRSDKQDRVVDLLRMVQLPEDFAGKKPHELSGGQLQRVALARALAPSPRFVFLDEPTSALDMSIRGQIINLLLDLQDASRVSYLFVTHDLRVVYFVGDRVMVMYLGQIVEMGTRDMIFHRPFHPYTHGLLAATLIGQAARQEARHISRIKGEVVQPTAQAGGCRLYSRCGYAKDECRREQDLVQIRDGHWVRCWRAGELRLETKAFQKERSLPPRRSGSKVDK